MHQKNVTYVVIGSFLDKSFIHEPYLRNGWHNLMHKAMDFNYIAIISIKENDYTIHFWYMRKDDAIDIMRNSNLNEKIGLL